VVEDNPELRLSLHILLQAHGYRVAEAGDGRLGLGKALEWLPEAAVLDIDLPGLDGYGLARRVRQALGDRTRLIALTADGQPGDRAQALASGFDHHLTKPCDIDELDRVLQSTCNRVS
jgi:CheY-like chemotaxis protein